MNRKSLSEGEVKVHRELFLDAIKRYETDQKGDERFKSLVSDSDCSLLIDLKERVEKEKPLPGAPLKLLHTVLSEYRKFLAEDSTQKPWINKKTMKLQIDEIDQLFRDDLV